MCIRDSDISHRVITMKAVCDDGSMLCDEILSRYSYDLKIKAMGCLLYTSIEARVIAYLAGEQWRLEVFKTHGKIYEASASQMFHVQMCIRDSLRIVYIFRKVHF